MIRYRLETDDYLLKIHYLGKPLTFTAKKYFIGNSCCYYKLRANNKELSLKYDFKTRVLSEIETDSPVPKEFISILERDFQSLYLV